MSAYLLILRVFCRRAHFVPHIQSSPTPSLSSDSNDSEDSAVEDKAYETMARRMFDTSVQKRDINTALAWGNILMEHYRVTVQPVEGYALSKALGDLQ